MIDWNRVSELRDEIGDEDFAEVAEIFLEEIGEAVDALEITDSLADNLHFLKGSALNLGFAEFATLCSDSETRARNEVIHPEEIANLAQCYQDSRKAFVTQDEGVAAT